MSVLVELVKKGELAKIQIVNPPHNVLSGEVLLQLESCLKEVKEDVSIKAVVLTGQGLFSVGANVQEIYELSLTNDSAKVRELLTKANGIVNAVQNLGKPTIAAITRFCFGGGNEIAMACNYRIATEDSIFGQPEINLGIIPGMGGTQRLPRLVGLEKSLPLLLTGNRISAQEAKEIGLVDEVVSSEEKFSADEAPVIRMVNLILQDAISNRASDIHFEPYETRLRIRYRIDGALREAHSPPREMYNAILTRIKIVSDLDITEKRLPQDGRFKVRFEHSEIDFRVSILPTYHGEKVVLRILDKSNVKLGLEVLGFTSSSVQKLQEAIKRPYGMVLVTGPTGSGKSTTLYSILNQFNTKDRNIMAIEDPVEYQIQGITQTQANADIGLTFANGLRSLLRQSPDVILVGEIRDGETADIAVKSALTGHLVFSTLHTNNACGAMTRLADMDVEPFLIASSLIAVTAQRLMRRSCPRCRKPYSISADVLARVGGKHDWVRKIQAKRGEGCNYCRNTGYRGRIATMEILVMDEEIQQMVIENRSTQEIEQVARKKGMRSLFEDALMSFENGETTLEEVLRVAAIED